MSPHPVFHSLLATCFMTLCANAAMAEIVKFINSAGAVTFWDVPCKAGEDAVRLFGPVNPGMVKIQANSPSGIRPASVYAHAPVKIENVPPDHGLGTDVATLKAAREMLASMDRLSKLSHQQAYAGRD